MTICSICEISLGEEPPISDSSITKDAVLLEGVLVTPCGHLFHRRCLIGQLCTEAKKISCHKCKKSMPKSSLIRVFQDWDEPEIPPEDMESEEAIYYKKYGDVAFKVELLEKKLQDIDIYQAAYQNKLNEILSDILKYQGAIDHSYKRANELDNNIKSAQAETKKLKGELNEVLFYIQELEHATLPRSQSAESDISITSLYEAVDSKRIMKNMDTLFFTYQDLKSSVDMRLQEYKQEIQAHEKDIRIEEQYKCSTPLTSQIQPLIELFGQTSLQKGI